MASDGEEKKGEEKVLSLQSVIGFTGEFCF
jgi:hypothetical protein